MRSMRRPLGLPLIVLGLAAMMADVSRGGGVAVTVTRIDDGDRLSAGTPEAELVLLRSEPLHDAGEAEARDGEVARIVVDPGRAHQVVHGLGAAMTDASASLLLRLKASDPSLYGQTLRRLFSTADGAGFSVLRLPMGTSDFAATGRAMTYCDTPSADLSAFSIAIDEERVIPALRDALAVNPGIRLIGSPWSPPAWMKTSGRLEGITREEKAAGATNRLRPEMFDTYAEYFVKFVEAYRAHGLEIWGVTLQNEPQFDAARYPCLRMDEADQIRLVALLGPKLKARGLSTRIFIHDHNWGLHPNDRVPVGGDVKLEPLESVTRILSDPQAGPFIAGTAWHGYFGDERLMAQVYDTLAERFPDKDILFTELSGWGRKRGPWWGDVSWGLARPWLGGFLHGQSMALEWNLALDERYGPSLRDDSEGLGLITIAGTGAGAGEGPVRVSYEREFYAMGQVSRAARPDWRRMDAVASGSKALDVLAFAATAEAGTDAGGTRSLVVFNRDAEPVRFEVRTDGGHAPAFTYEIPGRSLATFVW